MTTFADLDSQPVIAPPVRDVETTADTALAIAAAFLVTRGLVSAYLASQEPDLTGVLATQAWGLQRNTWISLATPPLARAYARGGLTAEQAQRAATAYAASLGDHLAESSGQALMDGFNLQLAARWPERTAWQRASSAYGLDGPRMIAWLKAVLLAKNKVPTERRVDDLLMVRAVLFGETEAWRAEMTGKTLGWAWMEQNGLLEAGTQKVWRTARDERTCPICLSLDGQQVDITAPFLYADDTEIFAPPAHPRCRCQPDLSRPPLSEIDKAWDDEEEAQHPRETGGEHRGRFTRVRERQEAPAEPEVQASPFTQTKASPFTQAAPFARPAPFVQAAPFAQEAPLAQTKAETMAQTSPFTTTSPFAASKPEALQRIFLVIPQRQPQVPELGGASDWDNPPMYFMSRGELSNAVRLIHRADHLLPNRSGPNSSVDFDAVIAHSNFDADELAEMDAVGASPFDVLDSETDLPRATYYDPRYPAEGAIKQPPAMERHFWTNHDAETVRLEAASRIRSIPTFMGPSDLNEVFRLADIDAGGDGERQSTMTDEDKRTMVRNSLNPGRSVADVQLAHAFMDYVAYVKPELSGQKGGELRAAMLQAAGGDRAHLGAIRFNQVPVQDIYVFAAGMHGQDSARMVNSRGEEFVPVRGKYAVEHISYEPTPSTPGVAAIRLIYLVPKPT